MDPNNYSFHSHYHYFPQAPSQTQAQAQQRLPPQNSPAQPQPQPLSQSHQQYHHQHPPQQQQQQQRQQQQQPQQPQPQLYYNQPYPQSVPQNLNYGQYYYNQDQHYQPQFQQYPPSFNPPQAYHPIVQTSLQSPQPAIQVVVPPHPYHSSPPAQEQRQQRPPADYQSRPAQTYHPQSYAPQIQSPSQSHDQLYPSIQPFQQSPPQARPQPHRHNQSSSQHRPNVSVDITSPSLAPTESRSRLEPSTPSVELRTQQRIHQPNQSHVLPPKKMDKPRNQDTIRTHEAGSPVASEVDYASLLCILADDYIEAARTQPALTDEYYNLIATALGCLESTLTNFKLPPLREAQISLRYAEILYEETENYDEAETRLTRSIELCERHKFIDLKYEMHLLLSKVLYESRPKAALRDLERMVEDIEAYRHTVWEYVFRFQHVLLSLASSAPGEVHSTTVQLQKIATLARQNGDSAVLAFAATLEALLHLSSSGHEAITATQTALAKARSLQLNPDVEKIPQMAILMEFIDMCCSIRECHIGQMEAKRELLQSALYRAIQDSNWQEDNLIYVPVNKRSIAGIQLHGNGHVIQRNGRHFLTFSWPGKEEVEALAWLFSAESSAYRNVVDNGKAERFAEKGLALIRALGDSADVAGYQQSQGSYILRKLLEAQFLFLLCFMQCSQGSWNLANDTLGQIRRISDEMKDRFPVNMVSCMLYLEGAILQGTGNLTAALEIYRSPILSLSSVHDSPSNGHKAAQHRWNSFHADSDARRNFCILAAMNTAFIIHDPHHPQHNQLNHLIKRLNAAVKSSANKNIQAHYSLLVSVVSTTTLAIKQYLRNAMDMGKAIGSAQITAIALVCLQERLFKGTVDEQAMKCAKAASLQVNRWGEPMWSHVVAGLEAASLELNGHAREAQQRRAAAEAGWEMLPEKIKSSTSD